MAYEIEGIDGDVIRVRLSGVIHLADHQAIQDVAKKLIDQGRKLRVLAITEHFAGWDKQDDWTDISFLVDYGDDIVKIAIVGPEAAKEDAFLFVGKGLRATAIEFFPAEQLEQAEAWVRA
jgi:CTP synthase (UTP-ammonia lyase)